MLIMLLQTLFKSRKTLILENLALRQQLSNYKAKNKKPIIHDFDRSLWIAFKKSWANWKDALVIVKPSTIIDWQQKRFKKNWAKLSLQKNKITGRKTISKEIKNLIYRMLIENSWGATKIFGELLMLGFTEVSQSTVSRYLRKFKRNGPDFLKRQQRWRTFLKNCRDGISAMDFFVVPTVTFKLLYVFFIIDHGRRRIVHTNVTQYPTANWVKQQLREAFPFDEHPKYLIFDRDPVFATQVKQLIKDMDIKPKVISYKSPWQNGVSERWVKSVRDELLNHVIIFNERHLRRLIKNYVKYYNNDRCHLTLDRDSPNHREVQHRTSVTDEVIALPRLNGLAHKYVWRDAA